MAVPDSIGVQYTIDVPLELVPGRDGVWIDVDTGVGSAAVPLPGSPGDVISVFLRGQSDVTCQIGDASVRATRASNPIYRGQQPAYLWPMTGKPCSHISFLALDVACAVIVNCYRRGS